MSSIDLSHAFVLVMIMYDMCGFYLGQYVTSLVSARYDDAICVH